MKFYVYAHYKPNEHYPFYIGKGSSKRAYTKSNRTVWWKNIVNKYGLRVEFIAVDLSEEMANDVEKEMIRKYGRADQNCGPLINLTNGGEGTSGHYPSAETRKKLSESRKGPKHPLYGKDFNGLNNPHYGKQHNSKTKKLISKRRMGRSSAHPKSILSPQGVVYTVYNRKEFAKAHNLTASLLSHLLCGKSKTHKGWTLPSENECQN